MFLPAERFDSKIVLIDGDGLAKLMIDHNVGVATIATYEVKRIDSDSFQEAYTGVLSDADSKCCPCLPDGLRDTGVCRASDR